MIISASRRTDIPAFYSEWFLNRIKESYFIRVNPYNPQQQSRVSLLPQDVDCFVFWTKNPGPFFPVLPSLDQRKYSYYFHFTLNNYPRVFEPHVPDLASRIDAFKRLSDRIGPEKVIWRYDPIILSNLTPLEYHLDHFNKLAETLAGYTERVVFSFLAHYRKVKNKFRKLTGQGVNPVEIREEQYREILELLAGGLSSSALANGMKIFSCSEGIDLSGYQVGHGSCIDIQLINKLFGLNLKISKDPSQRPECGCARSMDMGFYDTCKFGCRYCYANSNEQIVWRNQSKHNVLSPVLLR